MVSTPNTFNNSCKYSLPSSIKSKSSGLSNFHPHPQKILLCSVKLSPCLTSMSLPIPSFSSHSFRKPGYHSNLPSRLTFSQRSKYYPSNSLASNNSANSSIDGPISFENPSQAGRYSSNPRKRVFKVVKSSEKTEINVSVRSSKKNITFTENMYSSYYKARKQKKKLPQIGKITKIKKVRTQNNSPSPSPRNVSFG